MIPEVLGLFVIIHLLYASNTQRLIRKTSYLSVRQKKINSILNWLLPFIWAPLIRYIIREPKIKVMTRVNRKRNIGSGTDNWGSLTGGGGFDAGGGGSDGGGSD